MDWKKTFTHGQFAIHTIFVVGILATVGATLYSFRMGHVQKVEEQQVLKINQLTQNLKQDRSFDKISKFLSWAQADKAHELMKEFNQKIARTEEILEIKVSDELAKEMRKFDELINLNSGLSSPEDVLKILKQKIQNLEDIAENKKYRSVETISTKMLDRMNSLNAKNVGSSIQVNYMKTDINQLKSIVEKSTIEENEKNKLLDRFSSMNNELELLSNLNNQSRNLKLKVTQASLALSNWMLDVDKKAILFKDVRIQKQNNLIIMLSSIVAFLILSWMGMAYLLRWQKQKISGQFENEVKSVIANGILNDQRYMIDQYTEITRKEIIELMDDLKVKLNLGTLLHEGLPFAGCMIDHNFKLTWHNQLFLDQLYLSEEEVRSDAFNWDYVRDYLNLDQDPIYQALVNKIAGIYPVKIKQDDLAPSLPYEMYVTPVVANREERVMVFLYPLVSVKDAIHEQVQISQNAMIRFIELWSAERLDEDELGLLERDFTNSDLKNLYHELNHLFNRVTDEKFEYLHIINNLEKENLELKEKLKLMQEFEEERKGLVKDEARLASELKNSFVTALESSETLVQINKTILQQSDDFKNEAQRLQQVTQEALKRSKESGDIIQQLEAMKSEYKKLKFELMEVKVKLISMNNSLLGQLPVLDENQQKLANRYKDELARLDFTVAAFDKKLMQLDVLISKLGMIHEKLPFEQTAFSFQTSQKDHELREAIIGVQRKMNTEEGKVLDNFKALFSILRKEYASEKKPQTTSADHFLS
jgi:hypothetical protein